MIHLKVWGDFACFTIPESKVERMSFPIITPSAARGVLESIFYKKEFRWEVRQISVLSPIKYMNIKTNEIKCKIPVKKIAAYHGTDKIHPGLNVETCRTQRTSTVLKDVKYVISAEITNISGEKPDTSYEKYFAMASERIKYGQCFAQPCLGLRRFLAQFGPASYSDIKSAKGVNPDQDFNYVLYDIFDLDKHENKPVKSYFHARLIDGIVTVPPWNDIKEQNKFNQRNG